MKLSQLFKRAISKAWMASLSGVVSIAFTHMATAAPSQSPLFLAAPVIPIMMLNMSRDHQLYFKAYDDYSDILDDRATINGSPNPNYLKSIPDSIPDRFYVNEYSYYGYFDSEKCYKYNTTKARFEPDTFRDATTKACTASDDWSGNFLNWSTMTRMDVIRKILYGGYRAVDDTETVLERVFLPNDTHSFAKFYKPTGSSVVQDLQKVVPDDAATADGITVCNTTNPSDRSKYSQEVSDAPLMRVAKGDFSLWANNERWQCQWKEERGASNGNDFSKSGMPAASSNPDSTKKYKDLNVRVQVCVNGKLNLVDGMDNENCFEYSAGYKKPRGVLQVYGDSDRVRFGLITGTYKKSKSGGVLRKAATSFKDEVDSKTGVFLKPTNSIVKTLDTLRVFGYAYSDGLYSGPSSDNSRWYAVPNVLAKSDNCSWIGAAAGDNSGTNYSRAHFNNGICSNWGNPQAEIYLEALRYLSGQTAPTSDYYADDSGYFSGLSTATWSDPISETASGNYCAPLNILQFNASTISYDTDELVTGGLANVGISSSAGLNALTNLVGTNEGIINGSYFVGENGGSSTDAGYQLCTGKTITDFSVVKGNCPEAPRLEGGYQIAGLAYHARKNGLPAKNVAFGREKVTTFGVALAPATPSVTVKVTDDKSFTIMPACRNTSSYKVNNKNAGSRLDSNCAIVDFKIVEQDPVAKSGSLYVSWEDMEQGGDFDQDMWGTIKYSVSGDTLTVETDVFADSTSQVLGFGYILSGAKSGTETIDAGFRVHSGIHDFTLGNCSNCNTNDAATTQTYTLTSTPAGQLKSPLFYAAKWGGYSKALEKSLPSNFTDAQLATEVNKGKAEDTYFYATNPSALAESIDKAVARVAASVGSAATVAANSTSLQGETRVYQAQFNSEDWSGKVEAFKLLPNGNIDKGAGVQWSTDTTLALSDSAISNRQIFTYDGGATKATVRVTTADWETAAPTLRDALKLTGETDNTKALQRLRWILGYKDTGLRKRNKLLGDVVNSDPGFAGTGSQRHDQLPSDSVYGAASYKEYVKSKKTRKSLILVGANDGMLHAFNATTGSSEEGKEVFAYIPRGVYSKLAGLSVPNYSHQYSVDGPIYVSDYYNGTAWRTLVAGTLGAGGRGAYALDITDVLTGSGSPTVIFDVSADDVLPPPVDTDALALKESLGFSYSKVLVVPTAGMKWAAIWGNGTNSIKNTAKLIAIDVNAPGKPVILDTKAKIGTTSDNGLSGAAFLPDGTGLISAAYAGDIMGNMWKFDLGSTNTNAWTFGYGGTNSPEPLIKVIDPVGVGQPITAAPTLGLNKLRKNGTKPSIMVYFGTGKYTDDSDNALKQVQSLYGIADNGSKITLSSAASRASVLHKKVIASETGGKRTVNFDKNPSPGVTAVGWPTVDKSGWYLDLKFTSNLGERILAKPLLLYDRVIINTFIPSQQQCSFGGDGWLMELVGVGDVFEDHTVLGDLANSALETPIIGDLIPLETGEKVIIVGSQLGDDKHPSELVGFLGDAGPGTRGRMSWRQLK